MNTERNGRLAVRLAALGLALLAAPAFASLPASSVLFPTNGSYRNNLPAVSGTASALPLGTTTVTQVQISIRDMTTLMYWTGSGFTSTPQLFVPAAFVGASSGTWNYSNGALAPALVDGRLYQIQSQAQDSLSQVESPLGTTSFTYDVSPPTSAILQPANGTNVIGTLPFLSGTAADAASAISAVSISFSSAPSFGTCWNGSAWVSCPASLAATGTGAWNFSPGGLPGAVNLVSGNAYKINAKATDAAGNAEPVGSNSIIHYYAFNMTGSLIAGAVAATTNGQQDFGSGVAVDTITAGGPYTYAVILSTTAPNLNLPLLEVLVKYNSAGGQMAIRALSGDTGDAAVAVDAAGNVFAADKRTDPVLGHVITLTKYDNNLNPLAAISVDTNVLQNVSALATDGVNLFTVNDGFPNGAKVVKYDTNLVAVATATFVGGATPNPLGRSIALGGDGSVYVNVSSASTPGSETHLVKYNSALTQIWNSTITALTPVAPGLAVSTDSLKVYTAGYNAAGDTVFVRAYSAATGFYTGNTSTTTGASSPGGFSRAMLQTAPSGELFLGYTNAYDGSVYPGRGDYQLIKFDSNLNFEGSRNFNGPAGSTDVALGMAVVDSTDVIVTGASRNAGGDYDALTVELNLSGVIGGQVFAQATSLAPSTAPVSAAGLPMLALAVWSQNGPAALNSLSVGLTGNAPASNIAYVSLYEDTDGLENPNNGDGIFEPGTDTLLSSAPFSAAYPPSANLTFPAPIFANLTATTHYLFLTVSYSGMSAGRQLGLTLPSPGSFGLSQGFPSGQGFPLNSGLTVVQQALFANPAAQGAAVPSSVPAPTGGFDTGLTVQTGQSLLVTATGTWNTGGFGTTDALGLGPTGGLGAGLHLGSLVGRVGGGNWFQLGASSTVTANQTGDLFLTMNDTYYADNSGAITVGVQVLASTQAKVWTGASGVNLNASVNANWLNGLPPAPGDDVLFDGSATSQPCFWDIGSLNVNLLTLATSYAGTVTIGQTGAGSQLTVSSRVVVQGGSVALGGGATLTIQGELELKGGGFNMGPGGSALRLSKSGVAVLNGGSFVSSGSANVSVQAINPNDGFTFRASSGSVIINNPAGTGFVNSTGFIVGSSATVVLNNAGFAHSLPESSADIVFSTPNVIAPVSFAFSQLGFDANTFKNIDASFLPAGSTVAVANASGARMGSLFDVDPNRVVQWAPDGGSSGTISGAILNAGTGSGPVYVAFSKVPNTGDHQAFNAALAGSSASISIALSTSAGAYTLSGLAAPNTYYLLAWRTPSGTMTPSGYDPIGGYSHNGLFFASPVFLPAAGAQANVNLTMRDWSVVQGTVTNSSSQFGPIVIQAWNGAPHVGDLIAQTVLPPAGGGTSQPYALAVPAADGVSIPAANLYIMGFVDVNGDGSQEPFEAQATSASVTAVALSSTPGVNLSIAGGSAAAGGVVMVTTATAHPGYIGTAGPNTFSLPQAMLELSLAPGAQPASISSLLVDLTGAIPGSGYQIGVWRDDASNGVFDDNHLGGPGPFDTKVGETFVTGGVSSGVVVLSESLSAGTTTTYFVTLNLLGQTSTAPVSLAISSTSSIGFTQGSLAAQPGLYPVDSGPAAVLFASRANWDAQAGGYGGEDAGVFVAEGQSITVYPQGNWSPDSGALTTSAGRPGTHGQNTVDPSANLGQLVARIDAGGGAGTVWFPVSAGVANTAGFTGEVFLAMNNYPGAYFGGRGAVYSSFTVSGSTIGALEGTITYTGTVGSGNLVIRAGTTDANCPGCPNSPFNIVSTVTLPMSPGTTQYAYAFGALPANPAYVIDAFVAAAPAQTGKSGFPVAVTVGSTVAAVDFNMALGLGTLSGTITYAGVQTSGQYFLAVTTVTDLTHQAYFFGSYSSTASGAFSVGSLPTPNTFYMVGFRDVNGDNQPDGAEPFGVVGYSTGAFSDLANAFTPIFLDTSATQGGLTLNLADHAAISGSVLVSTSLQQGYDIVVVAGHGAPLSDAFVEEDVEFILAAGVPASAVPQPYTASLLRPATDYSVFAFVDVNNDGFYDPAVDPSGQIAGPIPVPQGGFAHADVVITGGAVPPPPVTGFKGSPLSTTQVVWTWNLAPGATAYQLRNSTFGIVAQLGAAATTYTDVLSPGAASSIRQITAANEYGVSAGAGSAVVAAFAAVPGTAVSTSVFVSSASLSWSANGNSPSAVTYQISRATNAAGPFFLSNATTGTAIVDAGLLPATTYFYKLQAFNVNGASTAFTAAASTVTLPASGPAISGAVAYGGGQGSRIVLQAFTNAASTGAYAGQTLLAAGQVQPYFLPLTPSSTYYLRAFVDILGDLAFHPGADNGRFQSSTAPATPVYVANAPVAISTLTMSVDVLPPATPFGLSAAGGGIGIENLAWFAPTTNADGTPLFDLAGFKLQRAPASTGPYATIGAPSGASFTDLAAPPGASVFYRVAAVDFAGNQSVYSGVISAQASAGGTISGNLTYVGTTNQGPFRVRLSSTPAGPSMAETTLNPFTFTGLLDGVYYVRAFRDLNGDGVQQDNEPGGALGGIAQPYPIDIFGANANTGATLDVCDRVPASFGGPGSPQSYSVAISTSGCPAQDQGSGFFTGLLSFRVGGGAPGSVGVGASVSIGMRSSFPNRLFLLGPDGSVVAQDSRGGGALINYTATQPGLYLIEPTSFNPYDAGSSTLTLTVSGGFSGTIAGTLSYSGAQTGPVILQLFNNPAANSFPVTQSTVALAGSSAPYAISGLQDGTYYLRAFRDSNGNLSQDAGEAAGAYGVSISSLTAIQIQGGVAFVNGASTSAISLALTDPAVGSLSGQILRQGSQTGTIRIEVGVPQTGCSNCSANLIAYTTIAAAGSFVVPFIPPATNYIVTSYVDVNGNAHADPLEAQAALSPVSVKPNQTTAVNLVLTDPGSGAAGNASIQGSISYAGASTGSLIMAFATDSQFQNISYTLTQAGPGTFLKSGVLGNTSYYIAAFLDTNGNGEPDDAFGEPIGFYGASPANDFNSKQPLFVSTGATLASITMLDASTGAISGQVTYIGSQFAGQNIVVHAYIGGVNSRDQRITIPSVSSGVPYAYTLPFLSPSTSWYVSAFMDANGNGNQDLGEPASFFGQTTCATGGSCNGQAVTVSTGPGTFPTYGVNIVITDPGQGNTAQNTGTIDAEAGYLGSQSGPIVVRVFTNAAYSGTPFKTVSVPMPPGPGDFRATIPGLPFGTYYLDAFRDPSGSGIYNPTFDAYGALQSETLSANNSGSGGGGGAQIVDPGQGGSVNVYSGSFAAAGGARFDGGAVDIAASVTADTATAGGPYLYVQGLTKQNAGIIASLVKYSSAGVFMSSATLPTPDTRIGRPALDASGNIYLSQDIVGINSSSATIVKYAPSLAPAQTVIVGSDMEVRDLAYFNGNIYAAGSGGGGVVLFEYSTSVVAGPTGIFSYPAAAFGGCGGCNSASGQTLTVDPAGNVYMVARSQNGAFAGAAGYTSLLKFAPGLGNPVAQQDISGLVPNSNNNHVHVTLGADSSGNVFLTVLPPGDTSAHTYKFNPSLQQVAAASFGPLLSHFGGGVSNLVVSTDNYVYEAWETAAHGGDMLALRYDDNLNLVSSRTFDGLDNAHEDFAFGLDILDSSNVYLTGGATNGAGNLDWATVRLNMNGSGAASGAGAAVVITTANATNAVFGTLAYSGTLVTSGTVRALLLPLGSSTPIRLSSAPFAASVPYLFNNVPAGSYQVRAFDDLNGNLAPDAGEPIGFSSSTGFQFAAAGSTQLNVRLCDRRPISQGVPLTDTITPADCPAADRGGASQRLYTFSGSRGQAVSIEMDAVNFYDTALSLYGPGGDLLTVGDDSGAGANAKIANFLLPADGLYTIGASPYAAGLSSATFKLSLTGSAGSLGSLSGTVTYSGAQGGAVVVALFSSSSFNNSLVQSANIPGPGAFSFTGLTSGSTYFLGAFIDVNGNGRPDTGEDVGLFGSTVTGAAPIFLRSGQNISGASFAITPGFSGSTSSGTFAEITGAVSYAGSQAGSLHVQFFSNSTFQGQPVSERVLPAFGGYDVPLPPNVPYYIRAYIDANGNNALDATEPVGVYAPRGQGAEAVFALSSGAISGVDIAVSDPGSGASGVAGDGFASLSPSTAPAGAEVFSATITYTAGATGIAVGGRVGFTVPQGFPEPQFVTVNSTSAATISAPAYSGQSAYVTVSGSALLPGQKLIFVYDQAAVPCELSMQTFSVSAAQNGLVPLASLFAGSPSLQVVPGPVAALQPADPYISLTQGQLSDPQTLEAQDVCGNKSPVTSPMTAALRTKRFDIPTSSFLSDATVGLSTGAAVSTSSALSIPFAVGRSSAPYFVISTSTGQKSLEVFYNLGGPTTFYYGVAALPTGSLSNAGVSTVSYAVGGSSVVITPNGSGSADLAYLNFSLADPTQPWHLLISSTPIKPGVAASAVWESWGEGQPLLGQIAWDGRYSPWINDGARVPSGFYFVRIEIGGAGVHDDSLLINVSVPQLAGHILDSGVLPNPPLAGVAVQVYGPNGTVQTRTDALGAYVMPGIVAGAYNMFFSRPDFLSGTLSVTVNAAGAVSTFTALSNSSAAINGAGGLDVLMTRSSVLLVAISSTVSLSTQAADLWGGLQVQSSTSAAVPVALSAPLHVRAGTTTFDDGGQWDASVSTFVAHTQFRFNVAVGTYTVTASLPGVSPSSAAVYVGPGVVTLTLPPFARKSSVSGQVSLPPNGNSGTNGTFISVNAVPLSTAALANGGFGGVFLPQGVVSGTYTVANLDPGTYLLRANLPAFAALSAGPVIVPASSDVAHVDFPTFTAGAVVVGTVTVHGVTNGLQHLTVSAWAPGSLNFGSTNVVVAAGTNVQTPFYIAGLSAGTTYQVFANLDQTGNSNYYVVGPGGQVGLPLSTPAPAPSFNFDFYQSSGAISGTILLPAGSTDFLHVSLTGVTVASAKPDDVGHAFSVDTATGLPNFRCLPANVADTLGYCPVGNSSASFTVQGENTETLDVTFFYSATGQTVKKRLSVVNGSTTSVVIDLSPPTYSISGAINNQITNALFNTNPGIVANAPFIAPLGYPASISSSTARIEAILIPDITQFNTAISSSFNPATTRVGYLTAAGTYTVTGLPSGSYLVRTVDLRSCATCSVLVPSVSQTVNVAGSSLTGVNFALSDGFTVGGTISLAGGIQDSQIFTVAVYNQRREVVRSTNVALGDPNLGLAANAVNYSFSNLPANGFYTLTVNGVPAPSKYAGAPIQFPSAALSPNGLQSNLGGQNVVLQRAAMIVGRLKDANTGALIDASQAATLAPNFQISAIANPWTNGGFVLAASSVANRPIQADGYFRVGPLIPNVTYDLKLSQTNWDAAYLLLGSQNYSPVTLSGLVPQPGEVRDVGVVSLNQGQSLTGTVRQSTTTGALLGGIEIDAVPSFNANGVTVQTFTNPQGKYTLWVSTFLSNTFNVTAAPRGGANVSSGTVFGQVTLNSVNLLATTTADFLLNPLASAVTSQVVVEDAATGGLLAYPFGANKGFPAAAINLQPQGMVPTVDELGDIEAVSDQRGNFSVPGLSTGTYAFKATSLGYAVFNATVAVSTGGFHIYTASDTPSNFVPNNVVTLRRGATLTGRIVKSDGTAPNNQEVGGIAAANFPAGEYLIGSVNVDPNAKTVNSYTISGFKPGVPYSLVILPADNAGDSAYPPEGANVTFAAVESTTTKNLALTYLPAGLDCLATSKGLGNGQFQLKIACTKPLRNASAADNDLTLLLAVSTATSLGAAVAAPNGTGQLQFLASGQSLSRDRRHLTAIYRTAAGETAFSLRVRAAASTVDPKTGANFVIDKTFDFFAGLDSNVNQKINNIKGGAVTLEPSGNDEALGLDERSRIDLPPGVFAAGLDTDPPGSAVAGATVAVSVGLSKATTQKAASALFMRGLGYVPSAVAALGNPSSFPAETWAAMEKFTAMTASTSSVGGANPLSSFYSIFLPAGIRHQLKQQADITFSYNTSLSTTTNPNSINVWFYNATLGKFVLENTNRRLDTNAKTITVAVNHFSVFVVLDGAPVVSAPSGAATQEIVAYNFPNPSDCVVHSGVNRDTRIFGAPSAFADYKGTMIRYSLPPGSADTATIRIYSLSGELVRSISQGAVTGATTNYFPWACDNQSGKTVASGVYIGEVQWGSHHKYFKIAIVKGSGL